MIINQDELSIYDVEALHKELLKELENEALVIDMQKVNKIDISIIQLFLSAQKTCKNSSKKFKILNVNAEVSAIFKSAACDFLLGDTNE